jgi:CBS domain-containing protein
VVAAAAAAIAAAAEAAGEEAAAAAAATAAAAREREALAATGVSCTIAEEGEENSSVVESAGGDADAEDTASEADSASDAGSRCSEEWWCGPLTGLTVRELMTGPLQVVSADADVSVARQLMVQHNLPGILVDVGPDAEPGFLTRRWVLVKWFWFNAELNAGISVHCNASSLSYKFH